MIRNYFKIAWRNILKNKGIFSINIAGLAIGIASCLLILLFVVDELSYDRFNEKADEIVRVVFRANVNGEEMKEAVVMAPVAQALKDEFPEVVEATRLTNLYNPKITYKNTSFRDSKFAYVDPNFFEIFTLPVIKGDEVTPLKEPNSVVLTEKEAKKYFGNEDPIGKILTLEEKDRQYKVTAIIEEVPKNSHFRFDIFASTVGYLPAQGTSWMNSDFHTYLLLKEGTSAEGLEAKLPAVVEKYMGPQMKGEMGMTFSEFKKDNEIGLFLQPLTDIHLKSDFIASTELQQGGDIKYIYIFSAVALFMLLIACINFTNLATAAASKRAKEVGIRKVLGSNKKQLIYQFLAESFIATAAAMILALILFSLALPVFNDLAGKELPLEYLFQPGVVLLMIVLLFIIGFFAGGYPAFFLSSFKPIAALKNKFSSSGKSNGIRSGLVVFQFAISAGLIFATLIVYEQMDFIQNKKLGYEKDQMLVLRESYLLGEKQDAFKNRITNDPRVTSVTQSAFIPAGPSDNSMSGVFLQQEFKRRMFVYNVDEQYIPTLGMELLEGRNFSSSFGTDSTNVIINERAAEILGFKKDPIGKTLIRDTNDGGRVLTVIGVVKDFHFKSLHKNIDPLIMLYNPYGGLIVRTNTANMSALIEDLHTSWNIFNEQEPFSYSILDDAYNETYRAEQKMGSILSIFTFLTIFVACLGLFGLVTYTAEQRIKEIGIRKVLGSSIPQIVALLSKDFLKLVFVSFLFAFPLGYYLMNTWLQDFAYRIEVGWQVFVLAAIITIAVAFLTISFKTIKAAMQNPVDSLRTE
ncbi:FtsX-like permease family protein [Antarcticibacterium flavum]|uniref:FtsX-like permease family protein n=1 Tax=Antarcticibacterium flavum TaxID=2058175 RepID=A0A5B7X8G2_9FLAO|nr:MULTISPECIES: ABC transporter permease [Antarcticibacterium]MCM4161486.1 cell division protein FtsX [Antarcticibacterium sp. W02-3]QCY71072.1 FtsX-like permease family protein [Antarcticibacterium flavum]